MKHYNKKPETLFETEIEHVAALLHGAYIKIPDPLITKDKVKDRENTISKERRRPFDGVLALPDGNFCIECKYNYKSLLQHQKDNLDLVNRINGTGWVLRKIEKTDDTGYRRLYVKYRKEKDGVIVFETDSPLELIKSFLQTTNKQEKGQ